MTVKISQFAPVVVPLFDPDRDEVMEGMEAVWVRILPPSWEDDLDHQRLVNVYMNDPRFSLFNLWQLEILLTYGGSNMSVAVPKVDKNGKIVMAPGGDPADIEWDVIEFDISGKLSRDELNKRLGRLPKEIIQAWKDRVLEVAVEWSEKFQL
jgi:hypothetical protein